MAGEIYAVLGETMSAIANAIRSKTGSDDFMTAASMASAIEGGFLVKVVLLLEQRNFFVFTKMIRF